ncbi:MAG TPA: helix-turn-helix domain-containing protein [Ktedonosporobacter sp.]|nr:helix-turn-helix domain-containing protein [Ktedonosporobacter sp.]
MKTGEVLEKVREHHVWSAHCPSRRLLDLIADKWTMLVIVTLAGGPKHYSQLKREVGGISHKMLSQTLQRLEKRRFVTRTVYPTVPPRVEYALTALAQTLLPTLCALIDWAQTHSTEFPMLEEEIE